MERLEFRGLRLESRDLGPETRALSLKSQVSSLKSQASSLNPQPSTLKSAKMLARDSFDSFDSWFTRSRPAGAVSIPFPRRRGQYLAGFGYWRSSVLLPAARLEP
jgi:hypothetical protein